MVPNAGGEKIRFEQEARSWASKDESSDRRIGGQNGEIIKDWKVG